MPALLWHYLSRATAPKEAIHQGSGLTVTLANLRDVGGIVPRSGQVAHPSVGSYSLVS